MNRPCLTVGLPVYNDPDGLRRSVPTVLGQTWQGPLRLLVVDDGCTDDTTRVLASLAVADSRIEVVRHPVNLGRPYARNTILALAGDDYLAWIDAGDLWHPRKLELQLAALLDAERDRPATPLLCTGSLRWVFSDHGENRIKKPDVTEDQLHRALVGTLYPYLPALVGRATHFREAGGFDVRLLRRQDYDFLVRFVGGGGRVVTSPPHVPVFTYLKSDAGVHGGTVARANRIIRAKHRRYYRRCGRRLARQVRQRQHRLVARFYRNNGATAMSRFYEMRESLSDPDLLTPARQAVTQAVGALRRWPPVVRAAAERLTRQAVTLAVTIVLTVLRQPRVTALVRWTRFRQVLATTYAGRRFYRRVRSRMRTAGPLPPPAKPPGAHRPRLLRLDPTLETLIGAGPQYWLVLESAYRTHGRLHSAERALRRGLAIHPDDPELAVRLIELLPLRKQAAECVSRWETLDRVACRFVRSTTYTRVLRALRALGHETEALAVAEEGLRRWPQEMRGDQEVYRCRAALVDWPRAVTAIAPVGQAAEPVGAITDIGFLAGRGAPLRGELEPTDDPAPVVTLLVNGQPVAGTSAGRLPSGHGRYQFSLSCHDLLPYLGDGDIVEIASGGRPLVVDGDRSRLAVTTGSPSRFAELTDRIRSGHVFTKLGAFCPGNTADRKQRTLALFHEISGILLDVLGYPAFPFYGNLLGAVREHDFIDHDIGGFDMGYVTRLHRPDDIRAEFLGICRLLLERGYHLKIEPWSTYIRPRHGSPIFVDLNYAWFNESGEPHFSYGWRYPPVIDRPSVLAPRMSLLGDQLVPVPGNAEEILEQLYGPSWAVPDQGFALDVTLKRDASCLLTVDEMTSLEQADPDRVESLHHHHPDRAGGILIG
jgi:glycosyltransferase involved in cell wall biosynthesis